MIDRLKKNWFLVALVALIVVGISCGRVMHESSIDCIAKYLSASIITAVVLFLMAFSLDSRQLVRSFRYPLPVLWGSLINFGMVPLLGWGLMSIQLNRDLAIGLMIAAAVPCTLAGASVWTRHSGGNDAVSLLVTMLTNTLCFAMTPFWLNLATGEDVDLDLEFLVVRLLIVVLVPTILGQLVRQPKLFSTFANKRKKSITSIALGLVLMLVFLASCRAGLKMQGGETSIEAPGFVAIIIVWATCIGLHLLALAVGYFGALVFGFAQEDANAVAFSSSQKTMPIGLLIATDPGMFGGIAFAVFPMLMFHASQFFCDTLVASHLLKKVDQHTDERTSTQT